jgi:tight adherence protein B
MDTWYYGFVTLGFLAVAGLIEGMFLMWSAYRGPEARRISQRLKVMSAGVASASAPLLKKRLLSELPAMQSLLLQLPRVHRLDRLLIQSGSRLSVADFLLLSALLAGLGASSALYLHAPHWFVVCALGTGLLPLAYILRLRARRLRQIEHQLPDALDLMARAMLAGHAFSSALSVVASEGAEPIAGEFRTAFDEINFGLSLPEALVNLAARVDSSDLRYFVVAVLVQRETGGNLAELLTKTATLIRARMRLAGTVRVLSAEGRISAWVLSLLPFLVAGAIQLVHPSFLNILWVDALGRKLALAAIGMMVFGIFWMWRVIAIRI